MTPDSSNPESSARSETPSNPDSANAAHADRAASRLLPAPSGVTATGSGIRRGFLDLLLLLILAGLAGADYLLYQMQQDQHAALLAQVKEMGSRLEELEAARDQRSQTRQAVETLNTELQTLRRQVSEALTRQQESVERLRQDMRASHAIPPPGGGLTRHAPNAPAAAFESPGSGTPPAPSPGKGPKEQYVDFVESTGSKVLRWMKEGANRFWDVVTGWFGS